MSPYSEAYSSVAIETPPALRTPMPLDALTREALLPAAAATLRQASMNPMRRAYVKVPRFKVPNKPYDLVNYEAATQAIATNMMSNASED